MHTADDHEYGGLPRERTCSDCRHSAHWGYCREDLTDVAGEVLCPCHTPVPGIT